MKTLITGASGFIGHSLLRQDLDGEIHTASRSPSFLPLKSTNHIGDLKDQDFVRFLAKEKYNRIIHLSWEGLPNLSKDVNQINLGTSKLFSQAMANSGAKEILIAGSCLEYGDLVGKIDENALGTNLTDFAEKKLQLLEFVQNLGIDYKWLRIFYAYGPRQHKNSLLDSAFRSASGGIPIEIKNPNIARDFIFVDDVARAITLLAKLENKNGIFNIGSGKATNVAELINVLHRKMGIEEQLISSESEVPLFADGSRLKKLSGWEPQYSIDQGISEYLKWKNSELLA